MGTLKAEAIVDKTVSDPASDADASELREPAAPELASDAKGAATELHESPQDDEARAKQSSIKRSIVSFLQPSVSPANDDRAASGRARKAAHSQRLKYGALLLASALLLVGAVYSLAQSDRFVTDLTVVSFVLILFFLIGLRIEATQGMLRDLSEFVETRSVGLDVGVDIEAAEHKVGAIDSAVARTLNRAGELQTLLRTEDLDFEKVYSQREERLRAVLEDMAVERAAITTNAEKTRLVMESAHKNLSEDVDAAANKFAQLLNDTGANLMARIEEQLQKQSAEAIDVCIKKLRSSLDGALIRAVEQVDSRGATLAGLISAKSEEFDEKLLNFKKEVALSLNGQIDDTQKAAAIRIEAMTGCINRLLDRMNSGIAERSESLNQMLATRVLEIASTLKTGKTEMLQTIESANALSSDMTVKSQAANELLQKQVVRLNESVVVPLAMLVDGLNEKSTVLTQDLARQFGRVDDTLKIQSRDLSGHLERHIAKLKETLAIASTTIEGTMEHNNAAQFERVDDALKTQSRELSAIVESHIGKLKDTLAVASATIEGTMEHNNAAQFERVDDALKTQSRELGAIVERHIGKLKDTLAVASTTIEGTIEQYNAAQESTLETLFKRHHRPLTEEMASVRTEFSAQRKLLAPLVNNSGRSDRSAVAPVSEPRESYQSNRVEALETATSSRTNGSAAKVVDVSAQRRLPEAEPTRPAETESRSGQSWLTDILARASSADDPMVDTEEDETDSNIFSAISTNIETLVSSDQVAAAWTAFKKREVSRFDQIYTPQGEAVFQKLKTLLDADDELKESVANYAAQFESLLRDRFDDEDERALLRYFTTPTGKVYTMLAHASKRLS